MKTKLLVGLLSSAFLMLSASALTAKPVSLEAAIKRPPAKTILQDKRCEKCRRGDDGKMECVEVACPN